MKNWPIRDIIQKILKKYFGAEFEYNYAGIRLKKTANGKTTKYALEGDKIIAIEQTDGDTTQNMTFYYGVDGISGFEYNGEKYFYRKNIFGDILGIYKNAELLVKYAYDAWGVNKTYVSDGSDWVLLENSAALDSNSDYARNVRIAKLNPFLYRGYCFDRETNLYYLNARYYDPHVGRFISPDLGNLNSTRINELNLYSYAKNNPIGIKYIGSSVGGLVGGINSCTGIAFINKFSNTNISNKGINGFHLFGYELRNSAGWDTSPTIATGWFGRFGISSYVTNIEKERKGILYGFAGSFADVMNWFGTTYYAGVGINLFDIIGAEVQLQTVGIGAQVSIGNFSVGASINLIGGTSITFGWNTDLGNGKIKTNGFTIGVNTGFLVAAIYWIYKFVTTGDPSPVPGLQPTY